MSSNLNSSKGDYIGDYDRGILRGMLGVWLWLTCETCLVSRLYPAFLYIQLIPRFCMTFANAKGQNSSSIWDHAWVLISMVTRVLLHIATNVQCSPPSSLLG